MQKAIPSLRPWLAAAAIALAVTFSPGSAAAAEPSNIHTFLDGKELVFSTPPVVESGRTLVPARALLEALGATVEWEPETKTVTAKMTGTEIKAVIGETTASVNGKPVTLDVPPRIIEGRTLVPLRFFAESLGLAVRWDPVESVIAIDSRRATVVSRDGSTAGRAASLAVETAQKQVGLPYTWGGTSPETGFDCSGLVTYVSKKVATELPRTSQEMFETGIAVTKDKLIPGDLVFFTTYAPGATHVGIYVGDGKFVHAQSTETGVKVTALSSEWWAARYLGARRVFR